MMKDSSRALMQYGNDGLRDSSTSTPIVQHSVTPIGTREL
jgi:hypothetical protein